MKSFAFVLCFVVVALASPVQQKWNRVHQECQDEPGTYVDDIVFEKLKKGEQVDLPPNFGLHARCMLHKLDFLDHQGHVKRDSIKHTVEKNVSGGKVDSITNECAANKGGGEQTALHVFDCFGKHHIDIGQF